MTNKVLDMIAKKQTVFFKIQKIFDEIY